MEIKDTVNELFEPTFDAIGDCDLNYSQKRAILYNLYCFACAVYPEYVASPNQTLFEYGCCFLIEPERHPDYKAGDKNFEFSNAKADEISGGGRWYTRRGEHFIKYDYGSALFDKALKKNIIPPQDREPVPQISLYAAVALACRICPKLRPLWFTYYFYLDATNEPVDEVYDDELWEMLQSSDVYEKALCVRGTMLIGDEAELGAGKLAKFYGDFIDYRNKHIFDVFERKMNAGDVDFVAEYSSALLSYFPENATLINWNAASRTEKVIRDKDRQELETLVKDLTEFSLLTKSEFINKYLKLARLALNGLKDNS